MYFIFSKFENDFINCLTFDKGPMIEIKSHNVEGKYLIIIYEIKFPGVTKFRILDRNFNVLYTSQYVDDVRGTQKIVLKYENMKSGFYIFELEFKNNIKTFSINKI